MDSNNNDHNYDDKKGGNLALYLIAIGSVLLIGYLIVSQYMLNHQ